VTRPLISIITPCLNRADFISEAVESVLAQNYPNFEHIVMDAGSTDGTLDILRSYPHLHVISEPDRGMYDGINKGLHLARGEILGLLNSDDLYAEGCFNAVAAAFDQHPQALAVVGGITTFTDGPDGPIQVNSVPPIEADELWYRLIQGAPVTNAWFFRPLVFQRIGYFDDHYRYVADRYFLIRAALDGNICSVPIHQVLYHYRQHSGSATISTLDSRTTEYGYTRMEVLQEDLDAQEKILARTGLPGEVRRRMRREHAERCYRLTATALYHHRWRLAFATAWRGWRKNFLWPLIFSEMAFRRLQKEANGHD
jgi:glycosyltransferase involved in cell wall biosynthesis